MTQPAIAKTRKLGLIMCTALVVGNMIGSGVFLLPASLAPLGWNSIFGWILTIAGGLCLAFVFASLARAMPRGGGPYAYTRAAFGEGPAFMVSWSYWIGLWVGNAAIATAGVSYLTVFFPQLATTTGLHAVVTLAIIWTLTAVNCRAATLAGSVQVVTTILKLLPLFAVILLAALILGEKGAGAVQPYKAETIALGSITTAATLALWSLLGLESATVPADQVHEPEKTIPRATMLGTILTGIIYLFVCTSVILLQPSEVVAASNAPLADFIATRWGEGARQAVAIFAAISVIGALNGWILCTGELTSAMAKDGLFPSVLARRSSLGAPVYAHIVSSSLLTGVVLLNYSESLIGLFNFVALLSTTSILFMYLAVSLAALKLNASGGIAKSAALMIVAAVATAYSVWAIYGAGTKPFLWGLALLAAGPVVYIATKRTRITAKAP
ncbi:MAG: amino acid permease [Parvularculaceae bacterium]|nr:amino acid permease [Parvularculaceae bacterium]